MEAMGIIQPETLLGKEITGVEDFIKNNLSKLRCWKLTSRGKKYPKGGFEFTIMTYNILSQAAVNCHINLYLNCSPLYLNEEYRISKILPEILDCRSDVVCLQEVEQHVYYERIRQVFDFNGFESIFKKRTGVKSDGCAILWRRDKFNLLRHHEVDFKTKGCEYLNRDNVGLIVVLKPRHPQADDQTELNVCTTHLIYNPKRGDIKLCQLRLLLAELEKSAFISGSNHERIYHPTVLCGDFNFEPHSPLYMFVEFGRFNVSELVAGILSGQFEGKDKGGKLFGDRLSLVRLGIEDSGHFTQEVKRSTTSTSTKDTSIEKYVGNVPQNFEETNCLKSELDRDLEDGEPTYSQFTASSENDVVSSFYTSEAEDSSKVFYHDFNFVPTYKYYFQDKNNYPITSLTGNYSHTVDHMFYNVKQKSSTSFTEGMLKLMGTYSLPYSEDIKDLGGLPNAHLGSDHLCLMSKFVISFKQQ